MIIIVGVVWIVVIWIMCTQFEQHAHTTCVSCCDSRVSPVNIFGVNALAQMFIVRNIGNQVKKISKIFFFA